MSFTTIEKKGISKFFLEAGVDPEKLSLHVSEAEAGSRVHPPHTHAGLEAFYMLEGNGTVETEGGKQAIGPGEVVIVDGSKPHGLANTGKKKMRYVVVIAKP